MGPIPEQTARVAQAAFPGGDLSMRMRDELGPILTDTALAPLLAARGRPAEAPWRLALVTMLQSADS
jgi:transposase